MERRKDEEWGVETWKPQRIKKPGTDALERVMGGRTSGGMSGPKSGTGESLLPPKTPQPQTLQPKEPEYGGEGRRSHRDPAVSYAAGRENKKPAPAPSYAAGLQPAEPSWAELSGIKSPDTPPPRTPANCAHKAIQTGSGWKDRAWKSGKAASPPEKYGPKLSTKTQAPEETGRGDFHRYARRPEVWELRDPAQVRYELEGLEEQYRVLYQDALDTLDRAEWSEDRDGTMVEAARKYKDAFALSPQISDLKKELKEIEEAQRRYLMEAEGYRDATPWDLTVGSLKQGYYNSRYGQESYKAMLGQENEKEKYQELLEGDEYKFVPSNWVERGLSGGLSMVGQQARQLTDPRTLGAAMTAAGTAAWLGNAGPQALAPEEVVTVPMATGAALKAGSALVNYEIEAGLAYNELLQNGVSEETARTIAQGVGGVNAALELVQLDELFKSFQILQKSGASQSLLQKIGGEVLRRAGSVGSETLQEMAQEGVAIAGVQAGSKLDKGEWAYSGEEVLDRMGQTGISSALSFGMLNVPGAVYSGGRLAQTGMNNWVSDQTADILLRDPQFLDYLDRKVGLKLTKDMSPEEKRNAVKDSVAVMIQAKKTASTGDAGKPRITMEEFTDPAAPIWNNVAYGDVQTQTAITQATHQEMVDAGRIVQVGRETMDKIDQFYPDLRSVKKKERTPVLRQKMLELKDALRSFLGDFKGTDIEFEVKGKVLEARLYDTGIREVLEKITQDKASMLYQSREIFRNAQYLYSTPDYDGNPNVYRWNYFYTPVQIGDDVVGVRIALRDMVPGVEGKMDSQIYNWGIKRGTTLDGGGPG